jgi:hypothetical protein
VPRESGRDAAEIGADLSIAAPSAGEMIRFGIRETLSGAAGAGRIVMEEVLRLSRLGDRPGPRVLRPVLVLLVCLGLAAGAAATLLGFLAPWAPVLEWPNHFRPYVLVGAGLLLGAAGSGLTLRRFLRI